MDNEFVSTLELLATDSQNELTQAQYNTICRPQWLCRVRSCNFGAVFFYALKQKNCFSFLPPRVQEELSAAYTHNVARCQLLEGLLENVLKVLHSCTSLPVLLKGSSYAYTLYPDPYIRYIGDIDLLISPYEMKEATAALEAGGFNRIPKSSSKNKVRKFDDPAADFEKSPQNRINQSDVIIKDYEIVFERVWGGVRFLIELHQGLINMRPGSGKEEVFKTSPNRGYKAREMELPVGKCKVLDYDDNFIHALRHLALHHRFIGFRWHLDLLKMLKNWNDRMQPERISQRMREMCSEKILTVELQILKEMFNFNLSKELKSKAWELSPLPIAYPLFRYVALGGKRTPIRELVRFFLAPNLRAQIKTLL